jgi:hypothetical protein
MSTWANNIALLVAASFLSLAGAAQAETRLSFSTGVDYTSGEYGGEETTEVISVPFGARLTVDDWTFRVSASYLHVTGPADISEDAETGESAGTIVRDGSEKGIGDTTISAEWAIRRIADTDAYVELTGRVRLPTGDEERGLGTGAVDYGTMVEAGVSSDIGGAYVAAGYRFLGERDEGPDRQDGMQAGVGAWLPIGNRVRVGAFANWREASRDDRDDPANAGAYVSFRVSERLRVTLTGSGGLSDASPDYSAGIRFNWLPSALNH